MLIVILRKIMYNILFRNLLDILPEEQFIGLGNPNSKILFIGKEAGMNIDEENFHGSLKSWKSNDVNIYSKKYIPQESKFRNLNHTWQRYQRLYDEILSSLNIENIKNDKYEINFVENIFTTELSNLHAPNTKLAKSQENFQSELKKRKDLFFKSDFIKNFQIIIIFASDKNYIETYPGEICELFEVKYQNLCSHNSKDKIWIHSQKEDSEKPKLVIHTRQLTNRITSELIPNIINIIVDFIKSNNIDTFKLTTSLNSIS